MSATKSKQEKAREVLSFLPRQDRHKPKGPAVKRSHASRWRAIVLIAVMTNAGLLVFTLNAFPFDSLGAKVWVFYLFQVRLYHSISSR